MRFSSFPRLLLVFVCLALLLTPAVSAQGPTPPALVPPPTGRPSAVRGRELFVTNCVPCHGAFGRGDGETMRSQGQLAPNFAAAAFHQNQDWAAIYSVVSEGRVQNLMPPWKNRLTPEQMWDVTVYSWWLGTGARALWRGQTVYQAECASCHGPDGAKVETANLSQAAQTIGLSQAELATRSARVSQHAAVWAKLSPADQLASLAYGRSLSIETPSLPPTNGVIQGSLRMGTPGETIAAGQVVSVTLFTFVGSSADPPLSATLAADGTFKFDSLVADTDHSYGVGTRYKGVEYFTPLIRLTSADPNQSTPLTVYETTTSDPGLRIQQAHVIAEFLDAQTLRIGELYEIENTGQRTFVPAPGGATFEVAVPPGSVNVRFQDDLEEKDVRSGDQIRIPLPWPPGRRQFLLSYDLPYNGNVNLSRTWPYPVAEANVLVADAGIQVQPTGLQARPATQAPNGGRYLSFSAQAVPARQTVTVRLSGAARVEPANNPDTTTAPSAAIRVQTSYQTGLRWLGLLFMVIGLASLVAWPRLRSTLVKDQQAGLIQQRERLLDQLADLDDAFAAGEIAETDYTLQRADAKGRLVNVMRVLRTEE